MSEVVLLDAVGQDLRDTYDIRLGAKTMKQAALAAVQDCYDILAEIGQGGFGTVYKARQLTTGQLVAIKVLQPKVGRSGDHERRMARFQREMQLCARLHHPNIVRLIDSRTADDGALCSVFEFVPGKNLSEVLASEGRLNPREAQHLMGQVLDALACAHSHGVVHRDLKPANIMVVPTGARRNALVLDFGIGALTDGLHGEEVAKLTGTNETLGTPLYAAPEQLHGLTPSPRSDLYSWALVFIESLTGERPIPGGSLAEIILNQISAPTPIPRALANHPLDKLLRRATVKDPSARDVTATTLLRELDGCDFSLLDSRSFGPQSRIVHGDVATIMDDRSSRPVIRPSDAAPGPESSRATHPEVTAQRLVQGERRQITAVSCSLISNAPAELEDLEDSDDLFRSGQALCADVARRFDGYLAGAFGEQLLCYFGYPHAQEDDARRAARAAVEMLRQISKRNAESRDQRSGILEIRLGIHTGLIVAQDLAEMTSGLGRGVGATPKLATTLCALASPGSIVISSEARKLLRNHFALRDLGTQKVPGQAQPVHLFELDEERRTPDSTADVAPLIGRGQELNLVLQSWARVRGGEGQCILLTGEPGIGKTRLVHETTRKVQGDAHVRLECRCAQDSTNTAFHPIADLLERVLEAEQTPAPDKAAKLEAFLAHHGFDLAEAMPFIAPLLAIDCGFRYPAPPISPAKQRERTLQTIVSLFFEMADKSPLLLSVEDLHWADPSTLDLLQALLSEVRSARVCVLLTARAGITLRWPPSSYLHIQLGRLNAGHVEEMVTRVLGGKSMPQEVIERVVRRTDGVPLFVEELLRSMIESGALVDDGDHYIAARTLSDETIPATLRDLLMARLDRLGRAKGTAQIAALLGRDCESDLLGAVSTDGAGTIEEDLSALVSAEVLQRKRRRGGATYSFRHALLQEMAYESIPRRSRQSVHSRAAQVLIERFPEKAAARPELLALHYAGADQKREAVMWGHKAAEAALQRSAYAETVGHASQALGWLDAMEGKERAEAELDINAVLAPALMATMGYAVLDLGKVLARSRELLDVVGESDHAFPNLWALSIYHYGRGDVDVATELAHRFVDLARKKENRTREVAARAVLGQCYLAAGRYEEAYREASEAARLYDPATQRNEVFIFGHDTRVYALGVLAVTQTIRGELRDGLERIREAEAWARELKAPHLLLSAYFGACCAHHHRREREAIIAVSDEVRKIVASYGFSFFFPMFELIRSWAERNLAAAEQGLNNLLAFGGIAGGGYFTAMVAELMAEQGREGEALERMQRCIANPREGSEFCLADMIRLEGQLLARSDPAAGEARLRQAIETAKAQGALLFELRASRSLSELLLEQGRAAEAAALMKEALARFPEGAAAPDLTLARALLEKTRAIDAQ